MNNKLLIVCCVLLSLFGVESFAQISWQSVGPGGGSFLMSSAIHPENADIMYVGGDIEGVVKTIDGGATWTLKNNGLGGSDNPLGSYGVQELVIDPSDNDILYACTWFGLYKSTDGAENWTLLYPVPRGEESTFVSYIAIDPADGQTLYIGIGNADANDDGAGSVYRSGDGGATWELLSIDMGAETVVHSIVIDPSIPTDNRSIYVSTDNGIFRSTDDGATWSQINTGLPHLNTRRMSVHTTGGLVTLFLSMKTEGNPAEPDSFKGGLYKSLDAGDTWVSINGDLPVSAYEDAEEPPPFYNFWKYQVHPTNPDIIYTGTDIGGWEPMWGVYKTINGGQNWMKVDSSTTYGWLNETWWNEEGISLLQMAPGSPDVLIIAGDAHIHKTSDAGQTWTQTYTEKIGDNWKGNGIELMVGMDVGFHPTDSLVTYIGYDDMGLWITDDGNVSFARNDQTRISEFDAVTSIAVDTSTGDIYVGRNGGIENEKDSYNTGQVWKSVDQGQTWTVISENLPAGKPVLLIDSENSVLYCGIYGGGMYKTDDGGATWTDIGAGLGADAAYVWDIARDVTNAGTLYLGLTDLSGAGNGGIYKTTDSGANWSNLTGIPSGDVLSVEVNPFDSLMVYAGITDGYEWIEGGGLYRSTDGGVTWSEILDQPRVADVIAHPDRQNVLFAVSQAWWNYSSDINSGLHRSEDGGQTWELEVDGLGNTYILAARINPHNTNQIIAVTGGGGAWIGDNIVTAEVTAPADSDTTAGLYTVVISPADTSVNAGETMQFSVVVTDTAGTPLDTAFTWGVSDTTIGTVDTTGLFTALSAGTVSLIATLGDVADTVMISVTDDEPPPVGGDGNTIAFRRVLPNGNDNKFGGDISEGGSKTLGGMPSPMNFLNGGKLEFPENSLSENITIYIKLPSFGKVEGNDVSFGDSIVSAVTFEVHVADSVVSPYEFDTPLTLTLPFKRGLLSNLGIDPTDLGMFFVSSDGSLDTTGIASAVVDTLNNTITATVAHFSDIALAKGAAQSQTVQLSQIDLSDNGEIDIWDVSVIAEYFGQPASAKPECDLNGNGEIDIWDVAVVAEYFGQSVP
jgi:photosystem II stability/assembly factor-like uncharacterized protein